MGRPVKLPGAITVKFFIRNSKTALVAAQSILNFSQHNVYVELSIKVSLKSPLVVRQEVERWLGLQAGWVRIPGGVPGSDVVVNPFSGVGLYLSKMGDRFNIAS